MKTRHALVVAAISLLAACQKTDVTPVDPPVRPVDPTVEPAVLEVKGEISSARATLGQRVSLKLAVTNSGGSVANAVAPLPLIQMGTGRVRVTDAAADGTVDLMPGETHSFVLTLEATDPGPVTLTAQVEALDGATGSSLQAELAPLDLTLESPVLLAIEETVVPMAVDVGQQFDVTVTVANEGEAAARLVAVELEAAQVGGIAFDRIAGPAPVAAHLMATERQAFTFTLEAKSAGNLLLKAHAVGIDDNDQSAVTSEEVTLDSIGVEVPARLTAQLVLPDVMTAGQSVVATLVVKNEGEGLARNVRPLPAVPLPTTVTGTAGATSTSTVTPSDIPGGGTATFTFSYVITGAGSFSLAAHVRGESQNSGAALDASAPAQVASVVAPGVLQIVELSAPAIINPTQQFDVLVKVKNMGGTAANGVLPDPVSPSIAATDGASARLVTSPAAQNLAPGATGVFTFHYAENGTSPGSLRFTAGARGLDAVSGASLTAVATQSNLLLVRPVPALLVEAVTLPAKLSRGQTFNVTVRVKNTGGSPATNVVPAVSFLPSTDVSAAIVTAPTAVTLAGGARFDFVVPCRETGIVAGTLRARSTAAGTNPNFNTALAGAAVASPLPATLVQQPATLQVVTFLLPAALNRGARFALGMVVSNAGQADARSVAPAAPTTVVTGGVTVALQTPAVALTIPGGKSRTFSWLYRETGTAAGTLAFTAGAGGFDLNSNAPLSAPVATSNAASVAAFMGCNGSALYPGIDGHLLDADRLEYTEQTDRSRVKAYAALPGEFVRVFGASPASIRGQDATFDVTATRWYAEQELSAISLYRAFIAGYQQCMVITAGVTAYSVNPTAASAAAECRTWQRRFWSATPTAAETTACANFAVSAQNDGATPREKWAAACATVAASMGFLAE